MITGIFLRHFKIYKGINYIPLSEGIGFSSIIGENGCGKSSVLEALDYFFNKKGASDWPVNNEAKSDGISDLNFPSIVVVFLIKKSTLRKTNKLEQEQYEKATLLSDFLWNTTVKSKQEFYEHRKNLKDLFDDHLLIVIGKKYVDPGVFFGSFQNVLTFINEETHIQYSDNELQSYFKGFNEYIISHYSYIHIPVETDVQTYTKLETQDMQKLMDKNIQREIEQAITSKTITQINKELDKFVREIEEILEVYHYKGASHKNSLTMPDLVSKIIEAYFSIRILNKRTNDAKSIPVSDLSSGEKRKAIIDVAYSFLSKNKDREKNIILAIDEPEASLHISSCFEQFDKLLKISNENHQIIVSTHWYGYLPIITNGSATAITKNSKNEIEFNFLNLYNYRENILQSRKQHRGPLPIDYKIKSYNDLVQSIVISIMQDNPYYWIICEGQSEKIYFDYYFKEEIQKQRLRILPVGGYKEVKKMYNYLVTPIKDPDYSIKGRVYCLIDTDAERVDIDEYTKNNKELLFERLIINPKNSSPLIDVNNSLSSPITEIEDCLNPSIYYNTLKEFSSNYVALESLFLNKELQKDAIYSANTFDLTDNEKKGIKSFFDDNEGFNKILFAKKYVELASNEIHSNDKLEWINEIKCKLFK